MNDPKQQVQEAQKTASRRNTKNLHIERYSNWRIPNIENLEITLGVVMGLGNKDKNYSIFFIRNYEIKKKVEWNGWSVERKKDQSWILCPVPSNMILQKWRRNKVLSNKNWGESLPEYLPC